MSLLNFMAAGSSGLLQGIEQKKIDDAAALQKQRQAILDQRATEQYGQQQAAYQHTLDRQPMLEQRADTEAEQTAQVRGYQVKSAETKDRYSTGLGVVQQAINAGDAMGAAQAYANTYNADPASNGKALKPMSTDENGHVIFGVFDTKDESANPTYVTVAPDKMLSNLSDSRDQAGAYDANKASAAGIAKEDRTFKNNIAVASAKAKQAEDLALLQGGIRKDAKDSGTGSSGKPTYDFTGGIGGGGGTTVKPSAFSIPGLKDGERPFKVTLNGKESTDSVIQAIDEMEGISDEQKSLAKRTFLSQKLGVNVGGSAQTTGADGEPLGSTDLRTPPDKSGVFPSLKLDPKVIDGVESDVLSKMPKDDLVARSNASAQYKQVISNLARMSNPSQKVQQLSLAAALQGAIALALKVNLKATPDEQKRFAQGLIADITGEPQMAVIASKVGLTGQQVGNPDASTIQTNITSSDADNLLNSMTVGGGYKVHGAGKPSLQVGRFGLGVIPVWQKAGITSNNSTSNSTKGSDGLPSDPIERADYLRKQREAAK